MRTSGSSGEIVLGFQGGAVRFRLRGLRHGHIHFDVVPEPELPGAIIPEVHNGSLSRADVQQLIAFLDQIIATPIPEQETLLRPGAEQQPTRRFTAWDCFFVLSSRLDSIQVRLSYQPSSALEIALGGGILEGRLETFRDGWAAVLAGWDDESASPVSA